MKKAGNMLLFHSIINIKQRIIEWNFTDFITILSYFYFDYLITRLSFLISVSIFDFFQKFY